MAENKITHAGVLKLPEPEWLTLKALAERWTSMSGVAYDIDKLLDLAVQRRLQISIHCPLVIPHIRKPRIKMTEGQYRTVQYRTKLGIPDWGVFGISPFDIERLQRLKKGEDFVLHSVLPNSVLTFDSENSSVVFVPTADNPPRVKNLIVTREEIERFEQRYFEPEEPAVQSEEAAPEEPAAPSEAAPEAAWKVEAREHYAKLKIEHPRQSKQQLAEKIVPLMKAKQRGNKPVTATNIMRYAIQNI